MKGFFEQLLQTSAVESCFQSSQDWMDISFIINMMHGVEGIPLCNHGPLVQMFVGNNFGISKSLFIFSFVITRDL